MSVLHIASDTWLGILVLSTPGTIFSLRLVCHFLNDIVELHCRSAFNIHRLLSRFFNHPTAFRRMQARTRAVISGSAALQFFSRTVYNDSDLDVYVDIRAYKSVCRFMSSAGYVFHPTLRQVDDIEVSIRSSHWNADLHYPLASHALATVFDYRRDVMGVTRRVQIIFVDGEHSVMEAILAFHSSTSSCFSFYGLVTQLCQQRSL